MIYKTIFDETSDWDSHQWLRDRGSHMTTLDLMKSFFMPDFPMAINSNGYDFPFGQSNPIGICAAMII